MASINGINNTIPAANFTVPAGTIVASGNITSSAGYVLGTTGIGAGVAPSTSGLVVSLPNRIGAWITGTNISAAGVDADGLFIDTSFAPTLSLSNAASIGLYPTFNPPGGVTITTGYGLYIASGTQGGAGSVTTGYGLFVTHPTFGTSNFAAQIDNIRIDVNTIAATNTNGTLAVNSTGTGTLSIGTNATAHSTVIGSTTASATTTIQAPTAGVILTGVQGVAVANKNYVTINTATGAIGSDAGASSSISITGDTGGALTGSSFTFTGGTTGLAFGGSGTTETLTFAGITANGGSVSLATDATASTINIGTGSGAKTTTLGSTNTTSTTVIKSGSGNVAINSGLTIDSTGRNTNTVQPCFQATQAADQTNVTGDGTAYTVTFTNEIFDQNNNFDGTSTFTAPVTGKYLFSTTLLVAGLLIANDLGFIEIVVTGTSAATYRLAEGNFFTSSIGGTYGVTGSIIANMTATDTAKVVLTVFDGTKVVDIFGTTAAGVRTPLFSGYLLC